MDVDGFDFLKNFGSQVASSAAESAFNRMASPLVNTYTKEHVEMMVETDRSIVARLDHDVIHKTAKPVEEKAVEVMTKDNVLKFLDENDRQDLVLYFRFDSDAQRWMERELRDAESVVRKGMMETDRKPADVAEMQNELDSQQQVDLSDYEENGHHEDT